MLRFLRQGSGQSRTRRRRRRRPPSPQSSFGSSVWSFIRQLTEISKGKKEKSTAFSRKMAGGKSKLFFLFLLLFRILHCFELQLKQQARSFLTPDMNIEGHFVLKSELTSLLTPSEIQEIVSSQSQKKGNVATVITPQQTAPDHHHHPYPLSSALLTSTPLQPHADELTHQLLNSLPTYANATKSQGAKPNLPNYYGSPTGSSSSATPNYVNTPLGLPTHTKTPIMERTWHTSNHRRGSNRHRRNQTLSPGSNHSNSPQVDGAGNGGVDLLNLIVKSDDSPRHLLSSVGSDESSPNSCQDHNSNALKSRYNSHSSGSCSSAIDDGSNSSLESDHGRSVSFSSDKFPPTVSVDFKLQMCLNNLFISGFNSSAYSSFRQHELFDSTANRSLIDHER